MKEIKDCKGAGEIQFQTKYGFCRFQLTEAGFIFANMRTGEVTLPPHFIGYYQDTGISFDGLVTDELVINTSWDFFMFFDLMMKPAGNNVVEIYCKAKTREE